MKDRTVKTVVKCVYDYILKFSIPLKFYSDRDHAFESEHFQCLISELKFKKLRTTVYNPRANGLAEKSNEFVKNFLTSYTQFSGENWDR